MKRINKVSRSTQGVFLPMGILLLMLVSTKSFSQDDYGWGLVELRDPGEYTNERLSSSVDCTDGSSPGGDESAFGNWDWGRGDHLAVYLYESDGGIGVNEVDNLIGYDTDNTWSEWSKEWKLLIRCYFGIDFKVRRSKKKDVIRDFVSSNLDDKKYYIWQIALRNRYNKDAYFEFGTTGVRPTTPAVGKRYQEETLDSGYDDLSNHRYSIPKSVERYAYTEKGDYVYLIIKNFRLGDDDETGYGYLYDGIGAKTKKYDKNEFEPCDY